jgi:L-alanine-DL-glutamate epimerase-like enolase superfamily enzyme
MRIDRIELIHIKMDLVSPFVTSMGTEYDEEHIIVRVDADGISGWGESVAEGVEVNMKMLEKVTVKNEIFRNQNINVK